MSAFDKIFKIVTPTAINLVFRSLRSELLAEAPWEFDPARDHFGIVPTATEKIPKQGVIRLFRNTPRLKGWIGTTPFLAAYFDGKKHHPFLMEDIHWQIPEFQSLKTEHDAWKAEQEAVAQLREEQQPTPIQVATELAKPSPTITIKVTPKD